ncbi:unnamed protein product [Rotaria magnacalcarata]|uniref:Uncharacterized protein n=1 Tax=Rotaria magnacalcarata TaxID=392030 RepID=A0A816YMI7_9BILA|nr:unnamed protein product [Rotaria magnacalcarata]
MTTSGIQFDSTTRARKDFLPNTVEKECEMQSSSLRDISINGEDSALINVISLINEHETSKDFCNSSSTIYDNQIETDLLNDNIDKECSIIST